MRVIAGPEKKARLLSEKEQRITAYHEMGHALVGHFLENTNPIHKITIVSRGQALGLTISLPTEDRYMQTKQALQEEIAMTLGGRAAEELVFNEVTTGAANDIERITHTAKQMVMRYGMSEKLGPRVLGRDHEHAVPRPRHGPRARLLGRDRARDRRRGAADHRGRPRARAQGAPRAHGGAAPDLADPDRARDDRQGPVRAPARRRGRGRGVRRRATRRPPSSSESAEPERRQLPKPRPFPLPGATMQPPEPEGA